MGSILQIVRRELRGGFKGFRLFLICLSLGVGVIAGVGSVSESIQYSIGKEAKSILGADIALRQTARPISDDALNWLKDRGTVSEVLELRAMAIRGDDTARTLVELKPVDAAYPLYGQVTLNSGTDFKTWQQTQNRTAIVAPELLDKLALSVGDDLRLGIATFTIADVLEKEPDRAVTAFSFGPRVLISRQDLAATGLENPGSLSRYLYRLKTPENTNVRTVLQNLEADFPKEGWQVRSYETPAPGMGRFVDQITQFLILVGLATLLVGGVGISNAVRSFLHSKLATIASLKGIGATQNTILGVYSLQILIMTIIAVFIGLALGAAMPVLLKGAFADLFPFTLQAKLFPASLISAGLFGLVIAALFSFGPLRQATQVKAADLFRASIQLPKRTFYALDIFIYTVLGGLCLALIIYTAPRIELAGGFIGLVIFAFILFRIISWGLVRLARILQARTKGRLRLALANIARPQNQTANLVLSIGLGLSVLAAVQLIDANFRYALERELPEEAPGFFFIDIQPQQVDQFDALVANIDGVTDVQRVPSLRGRIVAVDGVPVDQIEFDPSVRWATESDRGMTYAAAKPENADITAGQWWPEDYQGKPLLSVDERLVAGFGTRVGGTFTLNILGRDIEATIANTRQINWRTLGINFTFIFAPGFLENAPHTHIATVYADKQAERALQNEINAALPNVSAIRVKEALEDANKILASITMASQFIAALSLIAGSFVLAGAMLASHQRRLKEAVILKVLGATRGDVMKSDLLEYGLTTVFAASAACFIGALGSWTFASFMLFLDWQFIPHALSIPIFITLAAVALFTLAASWRVLSHKAAPLLRDI
jgi:putative ABC transport system permease protein